MEELIRAQAELNSHPLYRELRDLPTLRRFMRTHVFAVWDFMSLLKRLQRDLTCVEVPWRPSGASPATVRLINQIVLGEESDLDADGNPGSHFELYLKAMREVGAPTGEIHDFLETLDVQSIHPGARQFVEHTLGLARTGSTVEVAAAFFYGREKLIPGMFTSIVEVLEREQLPAPSLVYYLKRHIEVDGDEHGPLAQRCLADLIGGSSARLSEAVAAGKESLNKRKLLWDSVLADL